MRRREGRIRPIIVERKLKGERGGGRLAIVGGHKGINCFQRVSVGYFHARFSSSVWALHTVSNACTKLEIK